MVVIVLKMWTVIYQYIYVSIYCYLKIGQVLIEANKELVEVARKSEPSVLRQRDCDGMSAEAWMSEVLGELATRCPVVNNILSSLLESTIYPEKKSPAICLIYGIIMFLRCHELSRIQRINSVLLVEGQASLNVSHDCTHQLYSSPN